MVSMLDYVYGHDGSVAHFVATLIPHCRRGFGPNAKAIGVVDDKGRLIAGLVYHNWDPEAGIIEISGAALPGTYWLTRETLARMYQYPFHQCGCQMVVQRTPADDVRLLGILAAYGYVFVTVPRLFGRERDGVICSLTREAWENNRFNKRFQHHLKEEQEEAA
jgi:RimJ/RimL family protein N-acetyltransferase